MILDALYDLIRRFEGFRSNPYLCPAGIATVGYGSTTWPDGRKVKLTDQPVSEAVATAMMMEDANAFAVAVANLSPVLWFDADKHSAIADFAYNLGTTRYKASTLRKRVEAGDWEGAQEELQKWVFGGGKKLPGLVSRRAAEARLLRS